MSRDARHRHLFLADLEGALLPPLALQQIRLFRKDDRPVAFATWAFVSEEVEARLEAGNAKLKPAEWKSGDRCWIVDVVAPFGGAGELVKTLKDTELKEQEVRVVRDQPDRKERRVEIPGGARLDQAKTARSNERG